MDSCEQWKMDWQGHDYFLQGDSHLGMPSLYSHWVCFHVPRIVSVLNVLAEWMFHSWIYGCCWLAEMGIKTKLPFFHFLSSIRIGN